MWINKNIYNGNIVSDEIKMFVPHLINFIMFNYDAL